MPRICQEAQGSALTDLLLRLSWLVCAQVAAMFRPVPLAPGHDLFPQGAPADCMYVLQDGEVRRCYTLDFVRVLLSFVVCRMLLPL